jgi:hypothetical protein
MLTQSIADLESLNEASQTILKIDFVVRAGNQAQMPEARPSSRGHPSERSRPALGAETREQNSSFWSKGGRAPSGLKYPGHGYMLASLCWESANLL